MNHQQIYLYEISHIKFLFEKQVKFVLALQRNFCTRRSEWIEEC